MNLERLLLIIYQIDKDCENYALSKSVANINSIKITKYKEPSNDDLKEITGEKIPVFTDELTNRTVYSDGSIVDNNTGEEILSANFNVTISNLNKEIDGKELTPAAIKDKEEFNRRNIIVNPDLDPEQRTHDSD